MDTSDTVRSCLRSINKDYRALGVVVGHSGVQVMTEFDLQAQLNIYHGMDKKVKINVLKSISL